MSDSYLEFSAWNEPIDMHAVIPPNDAWLFDAPFQTTTSMSDLHRWLLNNISDDHRQHGRMIAGIPSRIVFKQRVVTKSPWVPA